MITIIFRIFVSNYKLPISNTGTKNIYNMYWLIDGCLTWSGEKFVSRITVLKFNFKFFELFMNIFHKHSHEENFLLLNFLFDQIWIGKRLLCHLKMIFIHDLDRVKKCIIFQELENFHEFILNWKNFYKRQILKLSRHLTFTTI